MKLTLPVACDRLHERRFEGGARSPASNPDLQKGFAILATSKVRTLQSSTGSYSLAIVRDRPSFNQLIKLRFRNSEFALQNFQSMRTKARRIAVSNRCSGEADYRSVAQPLAPPAAAPVELCFRR